MQAPSRATRSPASQGMYLSRHVSLGRVPSDIASGLSMGSDVAVPRDHGRLALGDTPLSQEVTMSLLRASPNNNTAPAPDGDSNVD